MYRVLLEEKTKKAYVVKCSVEELHANAEGFLEAIEDFVKQDNDIIIFCHDLGKLQMALNIDYTIELM